MLTRAVVNNDRCLVVHLTPEQAAEADAVGTAIQENHRPTDADPLRLDKNDRSREHKIGNRGELGVEVATLGGIPMNRVIDRRGDGWVDAWVGENSIGVATRSKLSYDQCYVRYGRVTCDYYIFCNAPVVDGDEIYIWGWQTGAFIRQKPTSLPFQTKFNAQGYLNQCVRRDELRPLEELAELLGIPLLPISDAPPVHLSYKVHVPYKRTPKPRSGLMRQLLATAAVKR